MGGKLPALKDVRDDVPVQLEHVLTKAAAMDPLARFASATALRNALKKTARTGSGQVAVAANGLLKRLGRLF